MLKDLLEQFHLSVGDTYGLKRDICSNKEYIEHVLEDEFDFHKDKKELIKLFENITYLEAFTNHEDDEYTKGWMFDLNGKSYTVGMMTYRSTTDYFFLNEEHDEYYDDKKSFNMWKFQHKLDENEETILLNEPHKLIAFLLQKNVNPEFHLLEDMYL